MTIMITSTIFGNLRWCEN